MKPSGTTQHLETYIYKKLLSVPQGKASSNLRYDHISFTGHCVWRSQWFPTGVPRHPRVPFTILKDAARKDAFQYIIKYTISKCR